MPQIDVYPSKCQLQLSRQWVPFRFTGNCFRIFSGVLLLCNILIWSFAKCIAIRNDTKLSAFCHQRPQLEDGESWCHSSNWWLGTCRTAAREMTFSKELQEANNEAEAYIDFWLSRTPAANKLQHWQIQVWPSLCKFLLQGNELPILPALILKKLHCVLHQRLKFIRQPKSTLQLIGSCPLSLQSFVISSGSSKSTWRRWCSKSITSWGAKSIFPILIGLMIKVQVHITGLLLWKLAGNFCPPRPERLRTWRRLWACPLIFSFSSAVLGNFEIGSERQDLIEATWNPICSHWREKLLPRDVVVADDFVINSFPNICIWLWLCHGLAITIATVKVWLKIPIVILSGTTKSLGQHSPTSCSLKHLGKSLCRVEVGKLLLAETSAKNDLSQELVDELHMHICIACPDGWGLPHSWQRNLWASWLVCRSLHQPCHIRTGPWWHTCRDVVLRVVQEAHRKPCQTCSMVSTR